MLSLLGGAARCGKTTLVADVAGRRGCGWLSTDTVRDVVDMLLPLYAFGGIGRSHSEEADRFFPYFERTVESCAYLAADYVIEGVGFFPRHVVRLDERLAVRAVFVGQTSVSLERILDNEGRNLWHRSLDDATLALVPSWIESWSAEIAAECEVHGFPFVDLTPDFAAGQARVEELLFATG